MEKVFKIIMGDMETPVFLAYLLIAFFSALLMLLIRADKKRKTTIDTPEKFSWRFFLQDNLTTFLINLLAIPLLILFSNELMGSEITGWISCLIGLTSNQLVLKLESFQSKARE